MLRFRRRKAAHHREHLRVMSFNVGKQSAAFAPGFNRQAAIVVGSNSGCLGHFPRQRILPILSMKR